MSRRIKFGVFAFLLLGVLLVCGFMVGRELLSRQKEREDFEHLVKLVTVEKPTATPAPTGPPAADEQPSTTSTPTPDSEESQEQLRDLSELFAMNDDFIGWLCIPGTDINYPVMHTPDEPERYLRRNFHGEYSESGVPFLDFRCSLDSDNLIIYGHNMMNGTMFAGLQGYVQKDFCEQHPIIEFQTADGCAGYQVFAVAWVKSNDEKYTFRVWLLRLGLIGDEFKTARHHLLKNLDGNIAWKDPAQAEAQKQRLAEKRLAESVAQAMEQAPTPAISEEDGTQEESEEPRMSM